MLSSIEFSRYNRQIILPEIGVSGQEKMKEAKVLVVGAGGLGCSVLQYLTSVGIGTIGIVDGDEISESNLQRQIIYTPNDIGKLKVDIAITSLQKQNPFTQFKKFPFAIEKSNILEIISQFDIIVDGTDNFETRYLVNDACVILKKKLVFGSILKFEGQISVFDGGTGPTYRCLFPEPPEHSPNCGEIGVVGVLPGLIGTLQANEVIKIITGIGETLQGKLFVIDALTMTTNIFKFQTNFVNLKIEQLEKEKNNFCKVVNKEEVLEIDVYQFEELRQSNISFQIIDVREENEFEYANIGGELLPLKSLPNLLNRIDSTKKIVVLCHHGVRSLQAVEYILEKMNHLSLDISSLKGGIDTYSLMINNKIPRY